MLAFHRIMYNSMNKYFSIIPKHFGSWCEAWKRICNFNELGFTSDKVNILLQAKKQTDPIRNFEYLEKKSIKALTINDPDYPKSLREIHNCPCVIYNIGNKELLHKEAVAIIGSRSATPYGLKQAAKLAEQLSGCGLTVVSGLARGLDAEAHSGALKAAGKTVAVLGSGIDISYPRENYKLYKEICEYGLVISEYPPQIPPLRHHFPSRNRMISGLSLGVLIIEAAARSGTLITCDYALDQGKEVFALPGPVTSSNSIGTLRLIQSGAKLVIDVHDILNELPLNIDSLILQEDKQAISDDYDKSKETLLKYFSWEPVHIDKLLCVSNRGKIDQEVLLDMEIKGLIKQLPGKYYVRV